VLGSFRSGKENILIANIPQRPPGIWRTTALLSKTKPKSEKIYNFGKKSRMKT
jgi:hypothetical protein